MGEGPKSLGEGERRIPLSVKNRRWIGDRLYEHLASIRMKEGVDPKRYPPVEFDIQYDVNKVLFGAEVSARETADLLVPVIQGQSHGKFRRIKAFLRHPLLSCAIIIAFMLFHDFTGGIAEKNQHIYKRRTYRETLGRSLEREGIEIETDDKNFTITIDASALEPNNQSGSVTLKLRHAMTAEELKSIE